MTVKRYPGFLKGVALARHASGQFAQIAAKGFDLLGGESDFETLGQLFQRETAMELELAAAKFLVFGRPGGVVLVLDFAHELLEYVLEGYQSGRAAILVHADGDVDAAFFGIQPACP